MSGVAGWKSVDGEWAKVDALIEDTLLGADPALAACLEASRAGGLPDIAVSPAQGKFLQLLVAVSGAKRVLEVGTLGGFSTIFLARGSGEGGSVVSLELSEDYAEVARANIARAAPPAAVEVRTGPALDSLPHVKGPIDFAFIDADKVNNYAYVDHAVRLARPGALVVVDNVVREGRVLDPQGDESAEATRRLYDHVAAHPRLDATALQTVGSKGWDGLLIARVA
jgi:predicted O-methyltransferase YrrM